MLRKKNCKFSLFFFLKEKKSNWSEFNYWSRFNAAVWGLRVGHKVPSRDGGTISRKEGVGVSISDQDNFGSTFAADSARVKLQKRLGSISSSRFSLTHNFYESSFPPHSPYFLLPGNLFVHWPSRRASCVWNMEGKKKECVCFDAWSRANGSSYREKRKKLVLFIRSSVHAC